MFLVGMTLLKGANWFVDLETEQECYEMAADYLRAHGRDIQIVNQPLTSLKDVDYERMAMTIEEGV